MAGVLRVTTNTLAALSDLVGCPACSSALCGSVRPVTILNCLVSVSPVTRLPYPVRVSIRSICGSGEYPHSKAQHALSPCHAEFLADLVSSLVLSKQNDLSLFRFTKQATQFRLNAWSREEDIYNREFTPSVGYGTKRNGPVNAFNGKMAIMDGPH